jgi:hypothetical protein
MLLREQVCTLVAKWEHGELPVVLSTEIQNADGDALTYVPLSLSLGFLRME